MFMVSGVLGRTKWINLLSHNVMVVNKVLILCCEPMMYGTAAVTSNIKVDIEAAVSNRSPFTRLPIARHKIPKAIISSKEINVAASLIIWTSVALPAVTSLPFRTVAPKYEIPAAPPLGKTWFTKFNSSDARNRYQYWNLVPTSLNSRWYSRAWAW